MSSTNSFQKPRGTQDILPDDQAYWQWIINSFIKRAEGYGFGRIETPIYEYQSVFTRGVGQTSDIVEKEMFEVKRLAKKSQEQTDTDKETMVLRPEGTAAIVRAYLENGMQTWTQPVRLYYIEPMFRYDRPQKGRYRQHTQLGLEYFGDGEATADAMVMALYWQLLVDLGLANKVTFNVNSLGDEVCRPKYKSKLKAYLKPHYASLCTDCQRRLDQNPLRVLDCKVEACRAIASQAPVLLDELCKGCKLHLENLLEYLDELSIPYSINPQLVRGLDYYNRTVFEATDSADDVRQSSLGGGGRYDSLIKLYGGKDTPAVGVGIGLDRLVEKLKEKGIKPPVSRPINIVVVPLGDKPKKSGLKIIADLNRWGIGATGAFSKESLKSQLKFADKLRVPFALILGSREVFDQTIIIRDMKTGVQDTINLDQLEETLRDRLSAKLSTS